MTRSEKLNHSGIAIALACCIRNFIGAGFLNSDGRVVETRRIWPHPGAGVNRVGGSTFPAEWSSAFNAGTRANARRSPGDFKGGSNSFGS
jgi:hypothetical protein